MNELQPHQQRVVEEHAELNDKIVKLDQFNSDPERWNQLSQEDQALLIRQRIAMKSYRDILEQRIAAFNQQVST